ncbi:hypothetical protein B932_3642 (plasmid) [Gluconobacter oxydans H24]|nr:hypothetical protein B932_3642 [Gluconobacter oxydans H24]
MYFVFTRTLVAFVLITIFDIIYDLATGQFSHLHIIRFASLFIACCVSAPLLETLIFYQIPFWISRRVFKNRYLIPTGIFADFVFSIQHYPFWEMSFQAGLALNAFTIFLLPGCLFSYFYVKFSRAGEKCYLKVVGSHALFNVFVITEAVLIGHCLTEANVKACSTRLPSSRLAEQRAIPGIAR